MAIATPRELKEKNADPGCPLFGSFAKISGLIGSTHCEIKSLHSLAISLCRFTLLFRIVITACFILRIPYFATYRTACGRFQIVFQMII